MVIVTDVVWKTKNRRGIETIHSGFNMDGYLAENLQYIPEFLKKDFDCVGIVSGRGKVRTGKCLGNETKVKVYKNGKIKDSKKLGDYKDGEILETISWDFKKGKQVKSKSKVIKNKDKKKLYIVELENGNKIKCSMDHKLFVKRRFCDTNDKNVWKIVELKLKNIKEEDELVCLK